MKIGVEISASTALRAGKNESGKRLVTIDAATLTPEERAEILSCQCQTSDRTVPGADLTVSYHLGSDMTEATPEELLRVVRFRLGKSQREAAEKAERERAESGERAAKIEKARAADPVSLIYHNGSCWYLVRDAEPGYSWPESDRELLAEAVAPAASERDRRNAAEKAEREQKAAAEKAEKAAALEVLATWTREHGSELARLRLEDGYGCWVSQAREDYDDAIAAKIAADLTPATDLDDDHKADVEIRKCPSAPEIKALRAVRDRLPDDVTADLIRVTYTPNQDEDGYDEDKATITRTELRLTITVPACGPGTRCYLIPE